MPILQGAEIHKALLDNKEQLRASAVTQEDFLLALKRNSKSVGHDDLQRYDDWMAEFGSV